MSVKIAVVGLACVYPGAHGPRELWRNILARRQQFRHMPDGRLPAADYYDSDPSTPDKTYGRRAALIDGFHFDPIEHRVPRSTFETTDIVHWLTLSTAMQAVGHAGLVLDEMDRDRIGMILGNSLTGEETRSNSMRLRWPFVQRVFEKAAREQSIDEGTQQNLLIAAERLYKSVFPPITEDSLAGGLSNTIAGRVCNALDLHGGGYVVDGACSSSLLAVATAAEHIASGRLDVALAGGVDVSLDPFELVGFAKATALSPDEMRVYDERGNGFIPGEGCGVAVLQRLDHARRDGRQVLAVLGGWGISSDGKGGLTAPSSQGQALALSRAYERAGYSPHDLDFVEGHGTGTRVGDRVELEGIATCLRGFGEPKERSVGVTSFKSLVGHTKAAAGIGGFLKAVMAVNRRVIPPTAACDRPHPAFADVAGSLYPVVRGRSLDATTTLRAGVSAMGFGGINCHVTLESGDAPAPELAPGLEEAALLRSHRTHELYLLGATDAEQLRERARALLIRCEGMAFCEGADLAAELSAALESPTHLRAAIVARTPDELTAGLIWIRDHSQTLPNVGLVRGPHAQIGIGNTPRRLGLLFPGQGSQSVGMGRRLLARSDKAEHMLREAESASDLPLLRWLAPDGLPGADRADELRQTQVAQPAICFTSAAWLRELTALGLHPQVVAGHSLGELTALYAAGRLDFKSLIEAATVRGRAMQASSGEAGTMAALRCDAETARELVHGTNAVIANLNAPSQTVLSGPVADVEQALSQAASRGIAGQRLSVSNAFHSELVAEASDVLRHHEPAWGTSANSDAPTCLSGVDGRAIELQGDLRAHLADQIVSQVDFLALSAALAERCDWLIEVGPRGVLTDLISKCLEHGPPCLPVAADMDCDADLLAVAAEAHCRGLRLETPALFEGRLTLPFVPASERAFYTNPCERPFEGESAAQPRRLRTAVEPEQDEAPELGTGAGLREALIQRIAAETGFPVESITGDLRLLDDLNLDSIKAGALLAQVARVVGVRSIPADLANSTIDEIAAAFQGSEPEAESLAWTRDAVERSESIALSDPGRFAAAQVTGSGALVDALRASLPGEDPRHRIVFIPQDHKGAAESLAFLNRATESDFAALRSITLVSQGGTAGTRAFAASLLLERPDVVARAIDLHPALDTNSALTALRRELAAGSGASRTDEHGVRWVDQLHRIDRSDTVGPARGFLSTEVFVVTGGAKGITAQCALALGAELGVRLALVGRSEPEQDEVAATLSAMRDAGIVARYYRCDITDRAALAHVLTSVRDELGPIEGVVHGAGRNVPRATADVTVQQALDEVAPKSIGAENLCELLEDQPPRLFVALTSIIGVSGMARNAWYAWSNERLRLQVTDFADRHPQTRALSVAYSIWADVGMGVRLGSVGHLAKQGISAIGVSDGVQHLMRWVRERPPSDQVIVASRLGRDPDPDIPGRFAGRVVEHTRHTELVHRLELHPKTDPYLLDHDFEGSLLFPTVFGLEAMAATARALVPQWPAALSMRDVTLERPIVVDPVSGAKIELHALVAERAFPQDPHVVHVEVRTESSGYAIAHFSATFVLENPALTGEAPRASAPLDIDPQTDLYGPVLFQGAVFQRIVAVETLDDRACVAQVRCEQSGRIGDPSARDALLQLAQLVASPSIALPVGIDAIETMRPDAGLWRVHIELQERTETELRFDLTAFDADGPVERMSGYRLKILRESDDLPTAAELADPSERDSEAIARSLASLSEVFDFPRLRVAHHRNMHTLTAQARHAHQQPLVRALGAGELDWDASGRPLTDHGEVSITHDDGVLLCVAAPHRVGVDLVEIPKHDSDTWQRMVRGFAAESFEHLERSVGATQAGVRLWTAAEAWFKATGERPPELQLQQRGRTGDAIWFGTADRDDLVVVTQPCQLTRGRARMLAVTARPAVAPATAAPAVGLLEVQRGPGGQPRYVNRHPIVFREASSPSGNIRTTHFVNWMGHLRELATLSLFPQWIPDFRSGDWGAVTNSTTLDVRRAATAGDIVEGSVWTEAAGGPAGSTLELAFEWTCNGERLASGSMRTTWVRITGHGEAEPSANPPYLQAFVDANLPQRPGAPRERPRTDLGELRFEAGPRGKALHEHRIRTGFEHSNIVGNIYFANYTTWIGECVDQWCYSRVSGLLTKRLGELRCISAELSHLREAMPFDEITIRIRRSRIHERGLILSTEVFRGEHKLAAGQITLAWFAPDDSGTWTAHSLPQELHHG